MNNVVKGVLIMIREKFVFDNGLDSEGVKEEGGESIPALPLLFLIQNH